MKANALFLVSVASLGALAACLPAPTGTFEAVECEETGDCAGGEICDVGVCWGNPPTGLFSAVITPPAAARDDSVMTSVPMLTMDPDGWIHDGRGGSLTLDQAVPMTGRVTIPCGNQTPGCRQPLGGQIRWSRGAGFPGGPRLFGSAEVDPDGTFQLPVPRPRVGAPVALTISFSPSQVPIGLGLPSPAMLHPPIATEMVLVADDLDVATGKIARDLDLDPALLRVVTGRIVRPTLAVVGWQLQAEVEIFGGENAGARQVVSTRAVTDADGNYTIKIAPDHEVVDVVCAPPPGAVPAMSANRPSVRAKDVVVTAQLRDIAVPELGAPASVRFAITGRDSTGATIDVDGATVVVRLDQALGGGVRFQLETTTTTTAGYALVPLYPILDGAPLQYTVDVLPGPVSELASVYGVPLVVGDALAMIDLDRRRQLAGRVLDAEGQPVAGAAVAATLSSAIVCILPTNASRLARSLASSQVATNARGEFLLFVDHELPDYALTYDIGVRPTGGERLPAWSFLGMEPQDGGATFDLILPPAVRVRGVVLSTDLGPLEGATLAIHQHVDDDPCASSLGVLGTSVLRATATTDLAGTAALVLPIP